MAKTPCGFCESVTRKITNEHVFAEWMGPLFGAGQPDMVVRHTFKRDDVEFRPWLGYTLNQEVRMPCRQCNEGWMSGLESVVQPIVTPMIQGHVRKVLTLFDQTAVARWAIKTAMVVEYLQIKDTRYFTQAERRSLIDAAVPSTTLGAHVWLARYADKNDGVRGLHATMMGAPRVALAHISTFALGEFAVQVLAERHTVGQAKYATRPGPWDRLLIPIWPPAPLLHRARVTWPPPLSLTAGDLDLLFDRFLALGAERGPYRPNSALSLPALHRYRRTAVLNVRPLLASLPLRSRG